MGIIISLFFISIFIVFLFRFQPPTGDFSTHSSPPTYPLIGCLLSFYKNRTRLLDWYTELLSESATGTIVLRRLGCRRTVVTVNPVNVEYILTTHFLNFPKGRPFTEILGDFLGCGIFNVDGDQWRTQRKLASHEFSTKSIQEFVVETLKSEVEMWLLPALEVSAHDHAVVDLQDLLRGFAFRIICKIVLGSEEETIFALEKSFDVASEVSARRATEPIYMIWKMKRWFGVGSERRLKTAVAEVHRKVMNIIHKRRKKKIKDIHDSEDLLSRLISIGHDDEVIRDMAISFIMAGRDTTSAAMTWLFWLLSHHPNIENQVVEEIDLESSLSLENKLDYQSLKELRFLKACLCETMRMYPPVPWDSKHAIADDSLPDGTLVRSGDRVTYFPYGMGRMEALWGKDQFEFKPSRWLLEQDERGSWRRGVKLISPYKFPIFHAGPRVCLGKEMAFLQMKYVVASILTQFRIKPIAGDRPMFVPLLTAHMAGGFKVIIQRREKEDRETGNSRQTNKSQNLNNQKS